MFIVKVPGINGLGKTRGCENAGNEILKCLKEEIYSNESGKPIEMDKLDLEEIHLDNSNMDRTSKLIYKNSLDIFESKPKAIFLGGDHSISYSTTRAFLDYCENEGKAPCLIVFDAHPDCMPLTKGCEKYPNHEEWLRALIEQGFPAKNILLVGVRNSDINELEFLKEKNIRIISMNQLLENLDEMCEIIMEFSDKKELYLSLDIDVVDPVFAIGTGYKEPGGLTSREFIYLLQRINKIKSLRAVDLVEINPEKDGDNLTVKLGAKILSEIV
ncbi:MAG: arginase family protein [Candidatus Pacearchaeota archaeon]|nr:arginase family protein [Candidatus Pacearchaeota archaeon]